MKTVTVKKKILFITEYSNEIASARYRVYQYIPLLKKTGYDIKILFRAKNFSNSGKFLRVYRGISFLLKILLYIPWYDCIMFQKYYSRSIFVNWLFRRLSKRLIFDFDDAIYATLKGECLSADSASVRSLNYFIRNADEVSVVSTYLYNYSKKFNAHVTVIPTVVDVDKCLSYKKAKIKNRDTDRVRIGWIGSTGGDIFLGSITSVFDKLFDNYGRKVELIIISEKPFELTTRIETKHITWKLSKETDYFLDIDIGIMPLPDNERTRGKGGFKLIQYMAFGIPSVASPVGINREIITDGINGFLADTEEEWIEKLSLLIESDELRLMFATNGYDIVREKFDISVGFNKLISLLEKSH